MIPKIIHSVWWGRGERSPLSLACMKTWEGHGWEHREWNEDNVPQLAPNEAKYLEVAASGGFRANVSNLLRYKVLHDHGGLYLDTDAEILKPLYSWGLWDERGFCGWESEDFVNTAILGAVPGFRLFSDCLSRLGSEVTYEFRCRGRMTQSFSRMDGTERANQSGPWLFTRELFNRGMWHNSEIDQHVDGMLVKKREAFYPIRYDDRNLVPVESPVSLARHRWESTWC